MSLTSPCTSIPQDIYITSFAILYIACDYSTQSFFQVTLLPLHRISGFRSTMHTTFVSPAFGFLFTTLIHAASAGVAPQLAARQDSSQLICTDDDVFKALFSNSGIAYEATSFCEHLIGLTPTTTCIAYNTTRTYGENFAWY